MKPLIIASTKGTPEVNFLTNGELSIEGLSLPEDPSVFFNPLMTWVKNFEGENLIFDVRLEYMNTSSSKQMHTLLCIIKDNISIKNVTINWYYEQDDEDAQEIGIEFESLTKLNFVFHEYAEVLQD